MVNEEGVIVPEAMTTGVLPGARERELLKRMLAEVILLTASSAGLKTADYATRCQRANFLQSNSNSSRNG